MADDAELVKAAVQGITEGTLAPFHQIVLNIFGPSSEALGRLFKERVKRFEKTSKEMFEAAGKTPKELSPKLLIPIIQNGVVEENDELQDKWAALLVNSTIRGNELPAAPEILRQLTQLDVYFLQMCYDHAVEQIEKSNREAQRLNISWVEVTHIFENWKRVIEIAYGIHQYAGKYDPEEWALTRENVMRLGLIKEKVLGRPLPDDDDAHLVMTQLGFQFIGLCQPPSR